MNKIIVGVGICIILVIFGYNMYYVVKDKKTREKALFPPWPSLCPDYWEVVETNKNEIDENMPNVKCLNKHKVGICQTGEGDDAIMDFSGDMFTDKKNGQLYKCKWSNKCNSPWEGMDNLC